MQKFSAQRLPCPVVGLTGSLASGKSSFARELKELGATIIDADVLAREVIAPGSAALKQVTAHFGPQVLSNVGPDAELNRAALAAIIFADASQRIWLEALLHPLIRAKFEAQLKDLANDAASGTQAPKLIVYVAPLLLEVGVPDEIQQVILVTAPQPELIRRAVARGGISEAQARLRLARQMPDAEKRTKVDYVIENTGSLEDLREQARLLFLKLGKLT